MNANAPTTTEEQPWASPMPGESQQWFMRASLFFGLGAARSVRAVYNAELVSRGKPPGPSRAVPSSWSKAAKRFEWHRRAEQFDAWRRLQIFNAGNAQDAERVKKLDKLIDTLCTLIMASLDRIDPNKAKLSIDDLAKLTTQLLNAIDLMARHCGGYAPSRIEHTGRDGKAIEVEERSVKVVFYMPEIAPLDDGIGGETALSDVSDAIEVRQGGTE